MFITGLSWFYSFWEIWGGGCHELFLIIFSKHARTSSYDMITLRCAVSANFTIKDSYLFTMTISDFIVTTRELSLWLLLEYEGLSCQIWYLLHVYQQLGLFIKICLVNLTYRAKLEQHKEKYTVKLLEERIDLNMLQAKPISSDSQ